MEAYEQRAKDRAEDSKSKKSKSSKTSKSTLAAAGEKRSLVEMEDDTNKEEFIPAATGAAGPHKSKRAFLKARTRKVDSLDSKIGTVEMINPEAVATTKANISEEGSAKVRSALMYFILNLMPVKQSNSYPFLSLFVGRNYQDRCWVALQGL